MSALLRLLIVFTATIGLTGFGGVQALFAPQAELWERWAAYDDSSQTVLDHGAWDRFLSKYVETDAAGVNRVAYGQVSDDDRSALDAYVGRLNAVTVTSLSRPEQFAYWVNLYNALTVLVVLEHYPVASIRDVDISPGLFSDGPWDKKLAEIEGERVSLNDIEHRILRPIWHDPRTHYALNCASVGCPNLAKQAYTAANSGRLLEEAARGYINDPRGARRDGDRVVVSSIYAWFNGDFGGSQAGVIAHLRKYASPDTAALLDTTEALETDYDWSLNDSTGR